jgi:hypothetical protein
MLHNTLCIYDYPCHQKDNKNIKKVLPERGVVGFPNFAWAPKKNNKNLGKFFFDPALPPLGPLGGDF